MADQWNLAEKAIKQAEQVNGEIINPAIYELRYAGRRVIEALAETAADQAKAIKLIEDAKFDCCRARHDAIDAATSKIAADLRIAVDKLGANSVLTYFDGFTVLFGDLQKVRRKIAASREDRDDRDKIYASIQEVDLDNLIDQYDNFQACEPLMKKAARRDRIVTRSSILLGVLGAIIGIFSLF